MSRDERDYTWGTRRIQETQFPPVVGVPAEDIANQWYFPNTL